MTTQEAYMQGFCKAAEVLGYDPRKLYKQAQLSGLWKALTVGGSRLFNRGGNLLSRYAELLKGGNKTLLNDYNRAARIGRSMVSRGIRSGDNKAYELGNKWLDALQNARAGKHSKLSIISKGKNGPLKRRTLDTSSLMTPEVVSELDKAFATRAGTAAAGLAGLGILGSD